MHEAFREFANQADEDLKKLQIEFQRLREKSPSLVSDDIEVIEQAMQDRGKSASQ